MSDPLSGSFRDPSGCVFTHDGVLYRQVNRSYQQDFDLLMNSGLYDHLARSGTLVAHAEAAIELAPQPASAYKVIKPERIGFISYPYEWSFGQLKDAAILTLSIARRALEYDMALKDASAYNVQFQAGKPIFIDTLSFERYQPGLPWVAYRQFCQHFLAPLALMAYKDIRLEQLLRVYIDGIPLDLASSLLPAKTRLSLGVSSHIHLHAKSQKKYSDQEVPQEQTRGRFTKQAMYNLLDSLLSTVRSLSIRQIQTEWADYYQANNYTEKSFESKRALVKALISQVNPKNVWDLGANTGEFSRAAAELGIPTVAFDIDPGAVQQNYQQVKRNNEVNMLPLVMDLTNPSPALGWQNRERESLLERAPTDLVMALALIHHLAIANNVPLHSVADFFAQLGGHLIIEFVPKEDSQVKRLLASRVDIFPDYNLEGFRQDFSTRYTILEEKPVEGSQRTLFLMQRKP